MKPPLAALTNGLSLHVCATQEDVDRCRQLKEGVPGWSELAHFLFFRELLKAKPNASILMIGVYHGLDLRYLEGLAKDLGQTVKLTGVDLFSTDSPADWPEDKKGMTWEQGAGCPPPNMEAAHRNAPTATIIKGDSAHYMATTTEGFDVVFLDGAHTEKQVNSEIFWAKNILYPRGFLCGDDYHWGVPTGGVDKAVQGHFPSHAVFFNRLWVAQP